MGRKGPVPTWQAHPEVLEDLVRLVEGGAFVYVACEAVGVSRMTFYRWLEAAGEEDAPLELVHFRESLERARALAETRAVEHLWTVAKGGAVVKERSFYDKQGNLVEEREFSPPTAQPVQFLLERGFSERWGRRASLAVSMGDGGLDAPSGKALSEDPLERLAARLSQRMAELNPGQGEPLVEGEIVDADVVEDGTQ